MFEGSSDADDQGQPGLVPAMRSGEMIASFNDYDGLRRALNTVRDHRKISLRVMNDLSGAPDGYFEKVLGPRPLKRIGLQSLGWALQGLGVKCILIEDPEAWAKLPQSRLQERDEAHFQSVMRGQSQHIHLSARLLGIARAKGGRSCWSKLTPKQRSAKAKRMAKARWGKVKSKAKEQAKRARQRKQAHKARKGA